MIPPNKNWTIPITKLRKQTERERVQGQLKIVHFTDEQTSVSNITAPERNPNVFKDHTLIHLGCDCVTEKSSIYSRHSVYVKEGNQMAFQYKSFTAAAFWHSPFHHGKNRFVRSGKLSGKLYICISFYGKSIFNQQ